MSTDTHPLPDPDAEYKWGTHDDAHFISIVAAPPGWVALFRKAKEEGHNPDGRSIHDLAWIEPIACFALVEVRELEMVKTGVDEDGEDEWEWTGRSDIDVSYAGATNGKSGGRHHRAVRPVWLDSGEMRFPGADEVWEYSADCRRPDVILGPGHDLTAAWVLQSLGGKNI